ncbi:MAG: GntR family transcriptional regulator [Planctomycetota bacterium]
MQTNVSSDTSSPAKRNRRAGKTLGVVSGIRGMIVSGQWRPGSQLPAWDALESRFGVARSTLTQAMNNLKRDGFIYSSSTRGTFVSERPPHLSRYAVAFRGRPGTPGWVRFWSALANEVPQHAGHPDYELAVFYDVAGSNPSEAHEALLQQVREDRFAGIVFVGYPPEISDELMNHPWLAKVAITRDPSRQDIPRVFPDRGSFVRRSLERVRAMGGRRLAVVTNGLPDFADYDRLAGEHGLELRPHFRVGASLSDPDSARHIVRLMLDRPAERRPDSLIITDDNLTESALAGAIDAGVSLPDDLRVLAHCNWPIGTRTSLPIVRLGFDARDVLRQAIDRVESQRHGRPIPDRDVAVPAVFESELPGPAAAEVSAGF